MAGVPSCSRVLATQRDDEDTIQDTLGRTLKARNKRGHERGHGRGREFASLRVWALRGSACIFFFLRRLVETRNPHQGSPHCFTKNITEEDVNKSVLLTIPLNMCVWRPFASRAHDFTDVFTWWETGPILSVSDFKERIICVFWRKHERVLVVFVSCKIRVMCG